MSLVVTLDGRNITSSVLEATSKHTLGKPYEATIKFPVEYNFNAIGKLLKIEDSALPLNTLDHHGRVMIASDNDDENHGYTECTSFGPDEIWAWRPARDGAASLTPGNFSKPSFITRNVTGPAIMQEILTQSADGSDPAVGEGSMLLALGSFAAGGSDLSGAPTNWPMSIAQIRALLQDTGELDVIVTPIDSGGNIGQVDCYNGNYGTDRSGSVKFEYETGLNNVRLIRRTQDLTNACTKLQYFLGPKIDDQHWRANITGTDERAEIDGGPPGGIAPGTPAGPPMSTVLAARAAGRAAYGVRMDIRIYDTFQNESDAKPLWWRLWLVEQLLRSAPRTIVHVTPIRGLLPGFDIGDIVGVGSGSTFRGGFATGGQRVYGRTISWDTEGVAALSEIQTSADNV